MRLFVDIESAAGVRYGSGPVTSATGWTFAPKLDRSGEFSFSMPISDPQRSIVQVKRYCRAWSYEGGVYRQYGFGVIEQVRLTAGADGVEMLEVSGSDAMRELTYRSVGELALYDQTWMHPSGTWQHTPPSTTTILSNAYDFAVGDTTTDAHLSLDDSPLTYLYVAHVKQFSAVRLTLGSTKNAVTATLSAQYYNGSGGGTWDELVIVDGTETGGKTLAQTGDITFEPPSGWGVIDDGITYEVRFFPSADLTDNVDLSDVAIRVDEPTYTGLATTLALAPSLGGGWSYDTTNGYDTYTGAEVVGDEILSNVGFETFTGTVDDGASDTFDDWTNSYVNDGAGDKVEASTTKNGGSYGVKITTAGNVGQPNPLLYQELEDATALDGDTDYILEVYTRGDGTRQAALRVLYYDGVTQMYITNPIDTGITGTTYTKYSTTFTTPPGAADALITIMLYGPYYLYPGTVYFDDVSLKRYIHGGVMLTMAGETVLETLIRIAEQTGDHFTISPSADRKVLWLRQTTPASGMRAISGGETVALEGNNAVCQIVDLAEDTSAYDLCSRIYAFGGGTGSGRVSLKDCTRSAPAGYTLDKTAGYLERDDAITAIGQIDHYETYSDINAINATTSALRAAANQVFDRAYEYLRRHSATDTDPASAGYDIPRTYALTLAGCPAALWPGYTLEVDYRRYVDGVLVQSVTGDLIILDSTITVDEAGVRTTAVTCSTVDARPDNDAIALAMQMRSLQTALAHKQAEQGLNSAINADISRLYVRDGRVVYISHA